MHKELGAQNAAAMADEENWENDYALPHIRPDTQYHPQMPEFVREKNIYLTGLPHVVIKLRQACNRVAATCAVACTSALPLQVKASY